MVQHAVPSLRGLVCGGTCAGEVTSREERGVDVTCTISRADELLTERAHFC